MRFFAVFSKVNPFTEIQPHLIQEMEKRKISFAYFFLLGKSEAHIETHKSDEYIVGDFEDTYDNLILKTKTSYEYFEQYCKKAKYYLLMDDDVTFS